MSTVEQSPDQATDATEGRPLTRAELAERIAFFEKLGEQALAAAKPYRAALTEAARREHEQGVVPSWRVLGLGVIAGRVSHDRIDVADPAALAEHVEATRPDEVVKHVRPAYVTSLCRTGRPGPGGTVLDRDGNVVPGLRSAPGGQFAGIAITFDDETKEAYGQAASDALARLTDAIYAEAHKGEGTTDGLLT